MALDDNVLDLLIVGGGPGGTAAAFRAKELGLKALIVEYDDLMKRIRDYSKDKLILPSFGGGDQMCFPRGGNLLDCLCFQPIDKDEMCLQWKGFHRQHGIESHIGVELTGLVRRPDGVYEVQAWHHGERRDAAYLARHIALAIGRGVPRHFDIPGNTDGIAFRLADPAAYTGRPVCVIGGGTSAAEAVIAVSHAKAAAGDPSAIYWSYRGDKMPRVSKALAEVFFEAYVGNGNIRYFPKSEPAAVVTGEDRREYLSVRVDRREMAGRPIETAHLEFPKDSCIACIGEDIPESLLQSLGIRMATGGPRKRRRMVVNRYLESEQPNVYLVGDILSQAYFETDDFGADPAGFREVKHRGNIKSALRDGVLVAQVVQQRLAGRAEVDVRVAEVEPENVPAASPVPIEEASQISEVFAFTHPSAAPGPPSASVEPARKVEGSAAGYLIRVLPGGVEEHEHAIASRSVTTIGRAGCDLSFGTDTMLSDRHASISHTEEGLFLRDDGSASGVFLEVPSTRKLEIEPGDLVRAGKQFLLFAGNGGGYSFTHYDHTGRELGRHSLPERTIILGRKAPDIILDTGDATLSRRHLAITAGGGKLLVKDLKSINGTFFRVRSAVRLEHGDRFRVGQQLLTFSQRRDAVLDTGHVPAVTPATPAAAPAPPPAKPGAGSASVTFRGASIAGGAQTVPVAPGQSICEAAEAAGVQINAECHSGICGSDPIRILSGRENLDAEPGAGESETLEDLCGLEAGECRLACMVKVRGPVEVEIL